MGVENKIRKILADKKLTGASFAKALGLGKSGVYKMLRGETNKMNTETAKLISEKFPEYSYDWLIGNDVDYISTTENSIEVQKVVDVIIDHKDKFMNNKDFNKLIELEAKKLLKQMLEKNI